jgi:uncharacterized membrane protein
MSTTEIDTTGAAGSDTEPADVSSTERPGLLAPPGFTGSALALVFAWQSFTPTLMPRSWTAQAAITGVCLALGYAIGALIGAIAERLLARAERAPSAQARRYAQIGLLVGTGVVVLLGLLSWPNWQNDHRDLLAMDHMSRLAAVPMLLVAAIVAVALGLLGRLVGRGVARVNRFSHRHLPGGVATLVTIVLVMVIAGFLLRNVVGDRLVSRANAAFGSIDTSTTDGTVQPDSDLVSGSPDSLAPWDTLGRQGRDFVAQATPLERITAFHGTDDGALDPIRVYVGLRTADSAEERAELAVAELERTGAFEREVLVVTTVTGTGWVDPDAAEAIEMLHRGDTAMVGMQYSFLPSWISTLVDDGQAMEAGAVLFDTVHRAWTERSPENRPQLLVFGQSLGSYGAEAAFAGPTAATSIANMVARTEGALFTGPTNDNLVWRQLTAERDDGSPVWRPIVAGDSVRFFNSATELAALDPDWASPRIVYVQHASDPVTFWSMDTLWWPPDWMDHPRGSDVPTRGTWFPVVTWVQGVFDLMAGFAAPPGHGHDYRLAFAGAWSQVAPPEGWTSDDAARLAAYLADG